MSENIRKSVRPFGFADKLGYFFGDFGNDFSFMLSSMFMMKFYTDVMGVSAAMVGFLMMVARFVDAVTDVTMGQIVDRSKPTKDGKFKPWIRRCCGPLGISAFLIFQSGFADMSMPFKIFWMFFTYLLWGSIFYTSVNIPYGSMASAISAEAEDRAQLSVFRSMGAACANLAIGTFTPMVAYVTVDGATVLSGSRMTIIAGVFAICGIICHMDRSSITSNRFLYEVYKILRMESPDDFLIVSGIGLIVIFIFKNLYLLHELEQQYGKLQNRMRIYQRENLEDIKKEIGVIQRETEEQTALMYQNIITAKSKAVTALANAQYSYDEDIEVILKKYFQNQCMGVVL